MIMDLEARGRELVSRLADAAQQLSEDVNQPAYDVETVLAEAKAQLDPCSSTGQELLDTFGMDLPSVLVKFTVITHGSCKEVAEGLLNTLLESCDPRHMFTAYMEALPLYSVSESLGVCLMLLDGLSKIFTRLRRRRAEYFKESLPGLLKVVGVAADTNDMWRILNKLAHIVLVLLDAALHEEVLEQRKRLYETLGVFILLLLARSSECEQLDWPSTPEPSMLQLATLIPTCGLTYLDLITGNFLEILSDSLTEYLVDEDGYMIEARQGAIIAVWWRFCYYKAAVENEEAVSAIIGGLKSSRHAFVSALSNVLVLLSSNDKTWKRVEMGIDLLTLILEWGTVAPSADDPLQNHPDFLENNEFLKLNGLLQELQKVVKFFPQSKSRQNAYNVFVNIIRKVLPAVERFRALKHLIFHCDHSSMVSLLLYVMKEEVDGALSSKREAKGQPVNSLFASGEVLEVIDFVLRPPSGGPPDLPTHIDAVLSALNLYRFLLIKESTEHSNYTGVISHVRLQDACSKWLQPLRTYLEGFKRSFFADDPEVTASDDPEVTASVLLSISIMEGVLYRCLELAEGVLKEHPS